MFESERPYHPQKRANPEDPFGKGVEGEGKYGQEGNIEKEQASWLSEFLSPEKIERIKQHSASEGHSTEWLIYQLLLAKLVETGAELPPNIRQRLRNLVGILRIFMLPNLTNAEQASLIELSEATTFDMRALQYEVNQEAQADISWIWSTFALKEPPKKKNSPQLTSRTTTDMLIWLALTHRRDGSV